MKNAKKNATHRTRFSFRVARLKWGHEVSRRGFIALRDLVDKFGFSLTAGDVQLLDGNWYVTHAGLLSLSQRQGCESITTVLLRSVSDPAAHRWVFRAIVYKTAKRGFSGYGDADPSNVPPILRGAEMRIAETRAVNRAIRKAYGIGLCSVEELGWSPKRVEMGQPNQAPALKTGSNEHHESQPRLRDQLCLLIRKHNLEPNLVKAYAAHFCGTETIKEASRDLVESFISH